MNSIVDWYRDSPQWAEVLAAARSGALPAGRHANPLWPIYGPLVGGVNAGGVVIGQIGQSLDGRIATSVGHSHYINCARAILHLHRLRALADAVVVGVGTVVADDPQLNVRHETGPAPARVVIDPSGRLPAGAKCLRDDGARRIVVHSRSVARPRLDTTPGVEFLPLALSSRGLDPADILEALAGVGLRRILVEGGAVTLSRFLAAGCLNRLHVLVAPIIIGAGPMGITLPPIARLDEALRPAVATFALPGGDMLFDCDFSGLKEGS